MMICRLCFRTTYGNRTRDSSVKGRRLNPLTNAAFCFWIAKVDYFFNFSKKVLKNFKNFIFQPPYPAINWKIIPMQVPLQRFF